MFFTLRRLSDAQTFIQVATIVCVDASVELGLSECCVTLHAADGRPALVIDNATERGDDQRRAWVETDLWQRDPLLTMLRETHAPVGGDHELLLPLVEPAGLLGSIRCRCSTVFSTEMRRDLATLSVQVSVRLAQLGISMLDAVVLTPRQQAVSELVVRGFSNHEVGRALEISANTVKKQLKEVYRRLDVANRTELAHVLRNPGHAEAPVGVTRAGAVTITRAG